MRRSLSVILVSVLALLAGIALVGPSAAQEPADDEGKNGGEVAYLNIVKVVDGDGPTGGYLIEFSCTGFDDEDAPEGGSGIGGALTFDDAGPGNPETQVVEITHETTCTVVETDSNGASNVIYSCDFEAGEPLPAAPDSDFGASAEGFQEGSCLDDQSGEITAPNDELTITVTNQFDPAVLPDDEEPPAVNPDVVAATPSFTG